MSEKTLPVIGLDELQAVVSHAVAYDAVRTALAAIATEEIDVPDELALTLRNDGEIHIKGGWLTTQQHVVFKVATGGFPAGTNSGCSILLDATTGAPAMVFADGGWLTEMRTAAAGAVATDLLAVGGPLHVAILGTGVQARYQLAALRDRREIRSVRIWGRDPVKTQQMAEEVDATACGTIAEAVDNVDVIVTATNARAPFLHARHLRPGVHVTAMGADMRGKRELAADVFDVVTTCAADDRATCARVGELQHVPGAVDQALELTALVGTGVDNGARRPRASADITLADLCGLGAYDAAIAAAALTTLAA